MQKTEKTANSITFHLGSEELIIYRRYEALSIINDILIGIWFLIGSIFFLYTSLTHTGTILFIIGSLEMLIRPIINFAKLLHIQKYHYKQ